MGNKKITNNDSRFQAWLAGIIVGVSLLIIGGIGIIMIAIDKTLAPNVFNIVIPVMSTWVGTVLAYYFSKENFAAATQSVTELARLTTQEKLKSIPVAGKMIPVASMYFEVISAANPREKIMLIEMIKRQEAAKKGLRIPILDEYNFPLYVIHRSIIDGYITKRTLKSADPKRITLKELLEDAEVKKILDESFGVVARNSTLADVKAAMEESKSIEDVFVTERGTAKEAIIGFITNTMLEEYSTV
jgi:hypothetical protein